MLLYEQDDELVVNGSEAVLQVLRGVVVNCRAGPKTQRPKECIVQFADVRSFGQATRLLGRKVVWSVGKREIIGKIVAVHRLSFKWFPFHLPDAKLSS